MIISRREFLRTGSSVAAVGVGAPALLLNAAARAEARTTNRSLVVIELNGGNDALNTLIPIRDPLYAAGRPTLAISPEQGLMLDKNLALHPAMTAMHDLYRRGQLAIIQGVGYPNPSRSHFRSMEIWHRADINPEASTGWLAGLGAPAHFGPNMPELFQADGTQAFSVQSVDETTRRTPRYPEGRLGAGLSAFAELIVRNSATRLFHISQSGFDTHARQAESHGELLGIVSSSIAAFLLDLKIHGRDKDVMVMVFSEFGRRLRENSSAGTDHGSAGLMFFAGGAVQGGLYGRYPSLADLDEGDLKHTVDFRDCYATVMEKWLGTASDRVLARHPGRLDFIT